MAAMLVVTSRPFSTTKRGVDVVNQMLNSGHEKAISS